MWSIDPVESSTRQHFLAVLVSFKFGGSEVEEKRMAGVTVSASPTTTQMSVGLCTVQWTQDLAISGKVCEFYLNPIHDDNLDYENIST